MSLMSRLLRHRPDLEADVPRERTHVSVYRDLLRTGSARELEHLHRGALTTLDPLARAHILRTAQDRLLSGREVTVDDIPQLARLLTVGEQRTPGVVVSALHDAVLDRLATAVLRDEVAQRMLADEPSEPGRETPRVAVPLDRSAS